MRIQSLAERILATNATVHFNPGDHLAICVNFSNGSQAILHVSMSDDVMTVRDTTNGNEFEVKGPSW